MSMSFTRFSRKALLIAPLVCLVLISPAWGIVLHNDADAPSDKPNDAVVGRWLINGSCVAVGKDGWSVTNHIITTRHQGYSIGTSVYFGGVQYVVAEISNEPLADGLADLRVCRIEKTLANGGGAANLTNFVQWYTATDESSKDIVIGGFGKGRGATGSNYYTWSGSDNQTQRWGTNRVDSAQDDLVYGSYTSDVLIDDFDIASSHDCAIAEWDSGGGWFIKDNGVWKVAALSAYTGYDGRSYWHPSSYKNNYGVRLSSYDDFLSGAVVPEPATLTLVTIGGIGVLLRRRRRR
ncbi:MAG: PEP-CTERM sorting domain-containing protein [Phycisphaerae bacterium]|nr:PEP-CTERM sorting domain-containing protein [Phycisphaerae bacterium]